MNQAQALRGAVRIAKATATTGYARNRHSDHQASP